jgi:drug/metabolite transporter (DMT)-like permease
MRIRGQVAAALQCRVVLSILLAFASAFASAVNVVTQHFASTAAPARVKGVRLALYLVRSPLWLFGVGAVAVAFLCQGAALYKGLLSVVQSILLTELVFTLVLGRVWLKREVTSPAWLSALVTTAGLAVFLVMSEPKGGHPEATSGAWLPALLSLGGLAAVLALLAHRGSPLKRAALYASAAGIVQALMATFLKSATEALGGGGFVVMLQRGAVYGLIVAGIVSTVLSQAALHYGPLAVSQPLMVIVNPVVSILLSVWIFGEHFTGGPLQITVAVIGFGAMAVGVVFLARTAPSFAAPTPAES